MATFTDTLETILKLSGAQAYQQALTQVSATTQGFAASMAEATAASSLLETRLVGGLLGVLSLSAALAFAERAFRRFAEQEAVLNRVGLALRQVGNVTPLAQFDELAHSIANLTGVNDVLILSQVEVLLRFRLTAQQIRELLPLLVDVSIRTGKSLTDVTQAVTGAFVGRAIALKRITGQDFKRTNDQLKDYIQLLKQLQPFAGAAAATRETPVGTLNALATAYDQLQRAIGGKLAPGIEQLINNLITLLNKLADLVKGGTFDAFFNFFNRLAGTDVADTGFLAGRRAARRARGLPAETPEQEAAALARRHGEPGTGPLGPLSRIEQNTANTVKELRLFRGGGPEGRRAANIRDLNAALKTQG